METVIGSFGSKVVWLRVATTSTSLLTKKLPVVTYSAPSDVEIWQFPAIDVKLRISRSLRVRSFENSKEVSSTKSNEVPGSLTRLIVLFLQLRFTFIFPLVAPMIPSILISSSSPKLYMGFGSLIIIAADERELNKTPNKTLNKKILTKTFFRFIEY